MLKEIELSLEFDFDKRVKKKFAEFNFCTADFLIRLLKNFRIGKIQKLVIEFSEKTITKTTNYSDYSVMIIRRQIVVEHVLSFSDLDKKRWTLKMIQSAFDELYPHIPFSKTDFKKAIEVIIKENYLNHYEFGKTIFNPSRSKKAGLWVEHDIDFFNLFLVVYDKADTVLKKELVAKVLPCWIDYDKLLGNLKWVSENEIHVFDKKKKVIKKMKA